MKLDLFQTETHPGRFVRSILLWATLVLSLFASQSAQAASWVPNNPLISGLFRLFTDNSGSR